MQKIVSKVLSKFGILFDLTKWIILVLVVLILVNVFWLTIFVVDGISMEPTFKDNEIVALNKFYFNNNDPIRGDVVVVRYPGDPVKKKYVKRIVGLPQDNVKISNGKIYINGIQIDEDYLAYDVDSDPNGSWKLKDDEYFLMGDNRPFSNDSRYFGPVEKRFLVGKAIAIIYPRFRDDFQ